MHGAPADDEARDTAEESNNPTLYMAEVAELPRAGQLTPPDKLALEQAAGPSWGQSAGAGAPAGDDNPQDMVMDMDDDPPPKKKRGCLIFIIIVLLLVVLLLIGATVTYFVVGVDRLSSMAGLSTTETPVVALPDGGVVQVPGFPDGGTIAIPTVPGVAVPVVPGVVPTVGDGGLVVPQYGDAAAVLAAADAAATAARASADAAATAAAAVGDAGVPAAETPPGETPPGETPPGETPPGETPPAETPPAETPPAETPPAETPPTETPPAGTPTGETAGESEPRTPERYVSRAQSRLRRVGRPCLGSSSASGRVTLTVFLRQNGAVSRATVSGNTTGDANLGRCLSGAVLNQRLGTPPRGVQSFQVTFRR